MAKKEYKRWEKSIEEDGNRETVVVEQVENGYIKTISTEGKNADGEWEYNTKKYISETNPMEELSLADKLAKFMKEGNL